MEEAYQNLRDGWFNGDRDRERALHLLFLSWWHWAEPDFLTGLSDDPKAAELWHAIFDHLGGKKSSDAEFLFVAAIMVKITPWALGDEEAWEVAANAMMAHALQLRPDGFLPSEFEDRGDYGEYFAHQARVHRS